MPPARPQPAPSCDGDLKRDDLNWGEHGTWQWRGQSCHWRVLGEPSHPPLVLVHGFAAGSGHWRRNAAALAAAGWQVFALDLLGFGASSQSPLWLDNRLWARQLQAFLEQVVQAPAVLVGHSLGGLVVLSCGVFFPAWVRAVVAAPLPDPALVAGPAVWSQRPGWRRLRRWLVIALCRLLPLELLVPLIARSPLLDLGIQSAYAAPVIGDQQLHRLIAQPARRPGAVPALRAMSIAMALRPRAATAPALLPRLRCPMLLLWGRRDQLVPLRVADQVRRLRGDLPLEVLDHCGHCPHDERSEAFNAALVNWLDRVCGAAT